MSIWIITNRFGVFAQVVKGPEKQEALKAAGLGSSARRLDSVKLWAPMWRERGLTIRQARRIASIAGEVCIGQDPSEWDDDATLASIERAVLLDVHDATSIEEWDWSVGDRVDVWVPNWRQLGYTQEQAQKIATEAARILERDRIDPCNALDDAVELVVPMGHVA